MTTVQDASTPPTHAIADGSPALGSAAAARLLGLSMHELTRVARAHELRLPFGAEKEGGR